METRYLDISGARNPHVLDRCKGVAHIVYRSVYCRGRVGRDCCCNKGSNDPRQSLPVAHSEKGILRLCKGVAPHSRRVSSGSRRNLSPKEKFREAKTKNARRWNRGCSAILVALSWNYYYYMRTCNIESV